MNAVEEYLDFVQGGILPERYQSDMSRADGSKKSAIGFLGPYTNKKTGKTSTELTVGIPINGKEMQVPTMVPTLTDDEINILISEDWEGRANEIPKSIIRKAAEHAEKRIAENKSVFYQNGEGLSPELGGAVDRYLDFLDQEREKGATGIKREIAGGLSFQFADELEALIQPGDYEENFKRITEEREEFKMLNPGTALTAELTGATASGFASSAGLARLGIKNLGMQGYLEGGAYGTGSGTTPEERAVGGAIGSTFGAAIGSGIQALTRPRKVAGGTDTREVIQQGDTVNYTKANGETVMAKVIGEENDNLLLTTDFLSDTPAPRNKFKVNKNSSDIMKRDDYDFDDMSMTPIERVPEGEGAPYTPLSRRPTQSIIDFVEEEVAGPPRPPSGGGVTYLNTRRHSNDERIFIEDVASKLFAKESDNIFVVTETELQKLDRLGVQGIAEIEKKFNLTPAQRNDIAELVFTRNNTSLPGGRYYPVRAGRSGQVIYLNDVANSAARAREKGAPGASPAIRITRAKTLAHELGHAAAEREFGRELSKHLDGWQTGAPKQGGFAVGDYSVAVPKAKTDTGQKIIDEWLASGHSLTLRNETDLQKFEEWLADSIARYALATAPKAPKGAAKKFFWQTGKAIRNLYRKLPASSTIQRTQRAGNDKSAIRALITEFVERHKAPVQPTRLRTVGRSLQPLPTTPKYREAPRPRYTESIYNLPTASWRDAKTPGEFWDGIKAGFRRTYDRLTPMTDLLQRNVSRQFGARSQRADETATKNNQLDFEQFVNPVESVAKAYDENKELRRQTLLFSENSISRNDFISFIRAEFGADEAANMARYLEWSRVKNNQHNLRLTGRSNVEENYLHRQKKFDNEADANAAIDEEFALPLDPGTKLRQYNVESMLKEGKEWILDFYQNPFFTNTRRIMNNEKLFQYAEKHGVFPDVSRMQQTKLITPDEIMQMISRTAQKRGISKEKSEYGIREIKRNLLGERKMMNQTLQALQTLGYAGTLAGPKSALLNLHDIPQSAVNQGPRAVRAWFQGVQRDRQGKMLSDSFGFSQQSKFGEFANSLNQTLQTRGGMAKSLNNTANATTNALMKLSLFQLFDKVGKGSVLRIVQQRAVDDVASGGFDALKNKWGTYFSDAELRKITRDLKLHGMDDSKYSPEGLRLTEELMMAGLGQQQLISAGGRPAIWADHPNARIFLALRGFAMKQQAVAMRNVFQNAREGNIQEAKDWALRYALYSMGAFAAINEGRQILFGDGEFSPNRVIRSFFDQLVGVMSLNSASISDYSWGKIQRGELLSYVIDNNIPIAFGVPKEAVEDALDVMTGEKELGELPETLPLVKQVKNLNTNIEEGMLTGTR